MSKPIAVVSGDIHFNLNTMHVADAAVRQAIALANKLNVPFISNGDMLDQKALLRAEYVNMIIETFKLCEIKPYVNVGNHSLINHKGKEHALNFLAPYAHIVDKPQYFDELQSYIIPYHDDVKELRVYFKTIPEGSRLFLHQGLNGSDMGEYIQDHSALNTEDLANFRSILSHYHNRQDIKCGRPQKNAVGLATYIGSPYTVSFAEANDAEKSIAIVYDDGTLEFVPTNLRKHVVIDLETDGPLLKTTRRQDVKPNDLVKVKLTGSKEVLNSWSKDALKLALKLQQDFKLELNIIDNEISIQKPKLEPRQTLDDLIDSTQYSDDQKSRLRELWRALCK